jgi:hypothetical protein
MKSTFFVILASLQFAFGQKDQFANNLKSCVAHDPDINVCLLKTLEDLRSLMPIGIPELNLRPTEPFKINNLKFKTRPGLGISIDSTFTDVSTNRKNCFFIITRLCFVYTQSRFLVLRGKFEKIASSEVERESD